MFNMAHSLTDRIAKAHPLYEPACRMQILPLDYDPDVGFANIENRLQMLIMNA